MSVAIELLSPAKDYECGVAAINHGADAVYIGAPHFSARVAAGNSIRDIGRLCTYAHQFHAQVHIALNTILTDSELEVARKMIFQLYDAGADALIFQDVGILQLDIPPIAIHASTQTDNRTVEKVKFWQDIGVQRVILARELSLTQIQQIRAATTVPLEAFVHGALCVSYSGRCYMSEACVGRSANRGACAQFCRLPYTLQDADGRILKEHSHLLSLKDLDRSHSLVDLLAAGVTSLKIEGRLKDIDYVKNVTSFYRQKLDAILEGHEIYTHTSSGKVHFFFSPNPQKTFHRGQTEYFLHKRENVMVHPDTPKSIGEKVGEVLTIAKNVIQVKTNLVLHNGDGLVFMAPTGDLHGFRINKVENQKITTLENVCDLKKGMSLYRNYDIEFYRQLQKESTVRKMSVDILFKEVEKGFLLSFTDEDGTVVSQIFEITKQVSLKGDVAIDQLRKQLAKLGNTLFIARSIEIDITMPYFFSVSVINEWRRLLVEKLLQKRLKNYVRPIGGTLLHNHIAFPIDEPRHLTFNANVLNDRAKEFYRQHKIETIDDAFEKSKPSHAVVMTCKHCIKYTLGMCHRNGNPSMAKEPLYLITGNHHFQLHFDCTLCEMQVRFVE